MWPIMLLLCASLVAADPPPVPDPIGLGERLALIDHLREAYGLKPAAGATLEQLRQQYAAAWAARQAPAAAPADPGAAERCVRLRALIARRHNVDVDTALDELALQDLLHRLDAERAVRDQAEIAALQAADAATPRYQPEAPAAVPDAAGAPEAAVAPQAGREPTPAAAAPAAKRDRPSVKVLQFAASGVSQCLLTSYQENKVLMVTFGSDHNGAFRGIREGTMGILLQAPAIRRGVLLLGHGAGSSIADESIAQHLATNKSFYETMGGTAASAPIDCLVFAACAGGGQGQMGAMRTGLGYYPTWRVATGDNAATTALNVLAALQSIASRPSRPAWRGMFRLRLGGEEIVSFGDVGEGGERAETTYWRIVPTEGGWKVEENR